MQEAEEMLGKYKTEIDQIEVPEELEERLNKALSNKDRNFKRKMNKITQAAAACFVILLVSYNFNTLAYYGKKLIGYDMVMNGTLKQLNELGKGQAIDKSYTFKNGIMITLNGIMLDENRLLAFYTIKAPQGRADSIGMIPYFQGLSKRYMQRDGRGQISDEGKEIKWITSFDVPDFYEKDLEFRTGLAGSIGEEGKIIFQLDRNKAMGHTLKKTINKTFNIHGTKLKIESILASPTQTVIEGSMKSIFELLKDQISGERLSAQDIEMALVANGKEIEHQGGGQSTDMKGSRFEQRFDALPEKLESLEIQLKSISIDHRGLNEIINLNNATDVEFKVAGQNIEINKVYKEKGNTFVTITTKDGIVLTEVYLNADGNKTELEKTIDDSLSKQEDGTVLHTRTLKFPNVGKDYQLTINRMKYAESYNKVINISTN